MKKPLFSLPEDKSTQARTAFLIASAIAVAHFVAVVYYLYLSRTSGIVQFDALAVISFVLGVITGLGAVLSRNGRPTLGLNLALGSMALSYPPVSATLVGGLGLVLGLALMAIGPMSSFQVLPRRSGRVTTIVTFLAGLATLLLDVFGSATRPSLQGIVIQLLAASVVGLVIYFIIRQFHDYPLRTKLVGVTAFIFILIAAALLQISSLRFQQQLEAEGRARLNGYYQAYASRISAESKAAGALAASIADRSDVQELYLKNDREGLYNLLAPMFEDLKKQQIVHLYIERPNGTVFLRVHNPGQFDDDVTYRGTAADALSMRKVTSGVEMGPNRLGVRGVAPMYSGNRFIGMVEVGLDFDQQFIDDLKELTGADFTMWVTYEAAAVPNLKPAEGIPAAPIEELFYYASTNPQTLPVDAELYRSILAIGTPGFQAITENTSTPSIVYITPLLGYKDKSFGLLEVSASYTDTLGALRASTITSLGVVGGLALIGLLLTLLATSQFVLKPINSLAEFANRQLGGDQSARVSVTSGDEFEQLADTFNSLSESVEQERRLLEQRVADRTKALATSTEVSRRLSTILDQQKLVTEVVEQVKDAFNYYHAHIYLFDEANENLVMAGGTGEAGQTLLARGHTLSRGKGLVGRAAETNAPVLVSDTSQDPNWLPNPLLPETKSEIAVPISMGNQVLGVLDVQHNIVEGLTQDDVDLLMSLASQVAIALQNARSFTAAQQRADHEAMISSISHSIQGTTTIEAALQTAARELGRALGSTETRVILEAPATSVASGKPLPIPHSAGDNNGSKPG